MTLSCLRVSIRFIYCIHNVSNKFASDFVRDLGFTLARNLSPDKCTDDICYKDIKLLNLSVVSHRRSDLRYRLKTCIVHLRPSVQYHLIWDPTTSMYWLCNFLENPEKIRSAGYSIVGTLL